MGFRRSPLATAVRVAAAVLLMSGLSWAVYYELGPSPDEWGLKYEGQITAQGDKVNITFTLNDPGRLKPIYSCMVTALSNPDRNGSRTYLLKAGLPMKPTNDGRLTGQVQINRDVADRAMVRIFTFTLDGQKQTQGARYYDIPLRKLVKPAPAAAQSPAPTSTVSPPVRKTGS